MESTDYYIAGRLSTAVFDANVAVIWNAYDGSLMGGAAVGHQPFQMSVFSQNTTW